VVASGLFLGWRGPQMLTSRARLNVYVFWEMTVLLLNGLVFVLIGLQLPRILHTLSGHSLKQLVWHGVLISCAAIVVRMVWVFASTYLLRLTSASFRKRDPYPVWQNVAIVAWTGMRGKLAARAASVFLAIRRYWLPASRSTDCCSTPRSVLKPRMPSLAIIPTSAMCGRYRRTTNPHAQGCTRDSQKFRDSRDALIRVFNEPSKSS
jgi:hypothetical protein